MEGIGVCWYVFSGFVFVWQLKSSFQKYIINDTCCVVSCNVMSCHVKIFFLVFIALSSISFFRHTASLEWSFKILYQDLEETHL